jgi:hypothetical protein
MRALLILALVLLAGCEHRQTYVVLADGTTCIVTIWSHNATRMYCDYDGATKRRD